MKYLSQYRLLSRNIIVFAIKNEGDRQMGKMFLGGVLLLGNKNCQQLLRLSKKVFESILIFP